MKTPEEKADAWCRANDAANCQDVYLAGYEQALLDIQALRGLPKFKERWPERFSQNVYDEIIEYIFEEIK
jgi:hypothetical protein